MRCTSCESQLNQGDLFCPRCGQKAPVGAEEVGNTMPEGGEGAAGPGNMRPPDRPLLQPPAGRPEKSPGAGVNGLAIASMVLGISGLVILPFLGAILAIVLGFVARGQIRKEEGAAGGSGFATAGIVLGITGLALPFIMLAVMVPVGFHYLWPRVEARRNLIIGTDAAGIYYLENNSYQGMTPEALSWIDDSVEYAMAPGTRARVVYIEPVEDQAVRLYCYSSRGTRYSARADRATWRYSFHVMPPEQERWWRCWNLLDSCNESESGRLARKPPGTTLIPGVIPAAPVSGDPCRPAVRLMALPGCSR